jgi:hypothetical protein
MKFTDAVKPHGQLSIYLRYKDEESFLYFREKNLITKSSRLFILSTLYSGGSVTLDRIVSLRVGTGGCIDPDGYYPKVESPTQTDLVTPLLTVDVAANPDTDNVLVTFLADIDTSQGNGSKINEAGLIKESGNLFNIKNHPSIYKTSDFSIHYEWTIEVL